MTIIKGKLKKWRNSLGIIIPKEIVNSEELKENQEINVFIIKNNKNILRETFGTLKKNKKGKSTEQLMREIDRDLYPEDYE